MAEYCTCKAPDAFTDIPGILDIYEEPIFVCSKCLKPSDLVYWKWKGDCDDCGCQFSSPIEEFCEKCIRAFPHNRPLSLPWFGWPQLITYRAEFRRTVLRLPT